MKNCICLLGRLDCSTLLRHQRSIDARRKKTIGKPTRSELFPSFMVRANLHTEVEKGITMLSQLWNHARRTFTKKIRSREFVCCKRMECYR